MASSRQERLKAYIELISRHDGGLESIEAAPAGLERGGVDEDPQMVSANIAMAKLKSSGDVELSHDEMAGLEAIILPRERPAIDIIDGNFTSTHALWRHLTSDAEINGRLRAAIPAIGRIELPGQSRLPYGGTGFIVGPGLVMTNRHVAEIFAIGPGDRNVEFRPNWQAGIDFARERGKDAGTTLAVKRVRLIHPYWDMALLEVEGLPAVTPLKLSLMDVGDLEGRQIAVIGYPAFDPVRNDVDIQNELFDGVYGVKRLQPGRIGARRETESFAKRVNAATHDCSTLGGNSGSAVIDLATGDVLALHFGGRYLDTNYGVPAFELARDGRVVDAGAGFAGAPAGGAPPWQDWWSRLEAVAGDTGAPGGPAATPAATGSNQPPATPKPMSTTGDGSVSITVPLHITIRLGEPGTGGLTATAGTESVGEALAEALVVPVIDTDYATRTGYAADFLEGVNVPPPVAADLNVLAPTKAGGTRLDYQNFSIWMHAERRIALITASNVSADPALKRPEPNQDYTRRGLSGLGANDQEKWFEDPRIDTRFQLPDAFYTKDKGAFDKGHIVRRDDAAWGTSYALVRRANGDTYHVTNCSPQVLGFNRSSEGTDNWGDLENLVLGEAASERLCVFAGPVLNAADETFVGTAGRGQVLRARIPRAYWKVVVARTVDGIAAYGFTIEQDLSKVALEFTVSENFIKKLVPIAEIEARAGIIFDSAVRAADQFAGDRGREVANRAGIDRVAAEAAPELPTPNGGDDVEAETDTTRTIEALGIEEGPIDWRVAEALLTLRAQVNTRFPTRKKANDGTIGDAAHASRSSDHNPWVADGRKGVVTAMDITHDPASGCDANMIAEAIRAARDPRVKYLIWNRRIANSAPKDGLAAWTWRKYTGKNPHDHHVHISVKPEKASYDSKSPWVI